MTVHSFGALILAVLVLSLMGIITIAAMKRYTFDEVLKIWQAQIAVFGVMIGAMTSYFFAQDRIADEKNRYTQAVQAMEDAVSERDTAVARMKTALKEQEMADAKWKIAIRTFEDATTENIEYDWRTVLADISDPNKEIATVYNQDAGTITYCIDGVNFFN